MSEGGLTTAAERTPSDTTTVERILVGPQAGDAWNVVGAISDALAAPREGWWPSFPPVKNKPSIVVSLFRDAAGTTLLWFVRRKGPGNTDAWEKGRAYLEEGPDVAPSLSHAVAGPLRGSPRRNRWPADLDAARGFLGPGLWALEHEMNGGATQYWRSLHSTRSEGGA